MVSGSDGVVSGSEGAKLEGGREGGPGGGEGGPGGGDGGGEQSLPNALNLKVFRATIRALSISAPWRAASSSPTSFSAPSSRTCRDSTGESVPINQAVAMARTDIQVMVTLLMSAKPVQPQQADPTMVKSMATVGVLGWRHHVVPPRY